jgi:hypothetical protein
MWKSQPLTALRASTACTGKTLASCCYFGVPLSDFRLFFCYRKLIFDGQTFMKYATVKLYVSEILLSIFAFLHNFLAIFLITHSGSPSSFHRKYVCNNKFDNCVAKVDRRKFVWLPHLSKHSAWLLLVTVSDESYYFSSYKLIHSSIYIWNFHGGEN